MLKGTVPVEDIVIYNRPINGVPGIEQGEHGVFFILPGPGGLQWHQHHLLREPGSGRDIAVFAPPGRKRYHPDGRVVNNREPPSYVVSWSPMVTATAEEHLVNDSRAMEWTAVVDSVALANPVRTRKVRCVRAGSWPVPEDRPLP